MATDATRECLDLDILSLDKFDNTRSRAANQTQEMFIPGWLCLLSPLRRGSQIVLAKSYVHLSFAIAAVISAPNRLVPLEKPGGDTFRYPRHAWG